ncbi:uncharacterized protein G2W53_043519 [Senna tora]|uniref:Uncharacterized protein n=1 Tax=Senna tora TaxID=362788 RepID=A0A834W005_9FABA|nr:uncharacterized protein G2W53_043519 [Senna tora]
MSVAAKRQWNVDYQKQFPKLTKCSSTLLITLTLATNFHFQLTASLHKDQPQVD